MSTIRIFTSLLAAGAALANPIAKPDAEAHALAGSVNLGPGIPTASGLTITSVSYFGDGCPDGSLVGVFCPETSSFNVTITELKAFLLDGQDSDDASCHIEVGLKTESQVQLNLLQGDFFGSVVLEEAGMTALAHTSVSFAGNTGGSNIPWVWYGPINARAVYEHNLLAAFVSQCSAGGEFLMLIDLVLHVTRGPASYDAVGFVDIDQLTGGLSQAYVLVPSPCGQTPEHKAPEQKSSHSGSYSKEEARKRKDELKKKKLEEKKKHEEEKEKKKASGKDCGDKCTYNPNISEEDERTKLRDLSKSDREEYYENKKNYELKFKYSETTKHGQKEENNHKPENNEELSRTRLLQENGLGGDSKPDSKCKRDGGCDNL